MVSFNWVRYCQTFVGVLTVQFGGFCEVNLLFRGAENEEISTKVVQ